MIKGLKKMPKGVKASTAFFLASVISAGMSYITTPIYTRILSSEEFGQVSLFMSWMAVFGIVAMFCLHYGVFNNGMLDYPEDRDGYSLSMLVLSNITTIIFCVIVLCVYPYVKKYIGLDMPFIVLMMIVFITQPAYNFYIARRRYEYKYISTFIVSVVSAVITPIITVICIFSTNDSRLYARIFGTECTLIFIYLIFYIRIIIKAKGKVNFSYWKMALVFNLPLIPHYLSTYLLGNSSKLMISYYIDDSATAYFSIAYSVASIGLIVWNAINGSLVPFTYEKCKKEDFKAISTVTIPILTVFAGVSVGIIMLAPEVVAIMATSEYKEAIYVIPPVVGGVFFQACYYIYANIVYYYKKTMYVMVASVGAVIINLSLNVILIPRFGYIVAGYTTLISYFIQACLDFWAMRKVIKKEVYDMKFIGSLSVFVIIVSLLSNITYEYALLRYSILMIMISFVIYKRKKIMNIIKEFGRDK